MKVKKYNILSIVKFSILVISKKEKKIINLIYTEQKIKLLIYNEEGNQQYKLLIQGKWN